MNSADKLAGWDNGQHFDKFLGHVVTTQSLDWSQGAGQVNFTSASSNTSTPPARTMCPAMVVDRSGQMDLTWR